LTLAHDFAVEATRRYLHNVVFVDDRIYEEIPVRAVTVDVPNASSMTVLKPVQPVISNEKPIDAEAGKKELQDVEQVYRPKDLVESFADEGMVCALYQPDDGFETGADSTLFKLCDRADVIILDWDLYKRPGEQILPLIANLVSSSQSSVPHHVRLCVIYTATPDLKKVASQTFERLQKEGLDVSVDNDFVLGAGASRIVVLGKPDSPGRPEDQAHVVVEESKLASRVIQDFADMHSGLLRSVALHGLASVRRNAKRVLDKFGNHLDSAFLIHRGLVRPGDDAFDQLPDLLAEEALAVMLDNRIDDDMMTALADEAIDSLKIQQGLPVTKGTKTPAQAAVAMLKKGLRKVDYADYSTENLNALHLEIDTSNAAAKERLAALYTSRTQYGASRHLEFGAVVRQAKEGGPEYSVCLMPLCDSIRLTNGTKYNFPFWTLRNELPAGPSKGVVIELPGDEGHVELFVMGKPRDHMWLSSYEASADKVVAAREDGGRYFFDGDVNVEWVAQLKPTHAQRIAQDIGASFSRVGVIEAEWLRLKASGRGNPA
jgi:hypothetical protein